MKKILLLQFIVFSLVISNLKVTATDCNLFAGTYNSHLGMIFQSTDKSISLFWITEPLNGSEGVITSRHQQYEGPIEKRAIRNLGETIRLMQSSTDPGVIAEGHHLNSLAYDLNPTIYIKNGELNNPSGETPKVVESDIYSISKLYENNSQFSFVEFITINVDKASDLATVLNPANFKDFTSLKYICISSSFEICTSLGCEPAIISRMVQGTENSDFMILYEISIPE